jgi:hypothetical protein
MNITTMTAAAAGLAITAAASAQAFDVIGGQTSVLLDTDLLNSAAGLELSGTDGPIIVPGELGTGSVAFPINARDEATLPTTFSYDPGLADFSGTIEHQGSVLFNSNSVEVGNFTIGFDNARASGDNSGFFVESTVGVAAILFDIQSPSAVVANAETLQITANLLVSPEFAGFLTDNGLAGSDLTGADVGDAFVNAIPSPGAAGVLGIAGLAAIRRRR